MSEQQRDTLAPKTTNAELSVLRCPPQHCQCGKGGGQKLCIVFYPAGTPIVWEGVCPRDKSRVFQLEINGGGR